jgi:hypothetical protein
MSILNDIWNRIARKPDRRKAAVTETSGTENRVYAVVTEEGVILFSDTPKGMKARHTFATTITLSQGMPIETVSCLLGHTNIKTTQIYAKITNEKISRDMSALTERLGDKYRLAE